MVKINSLFCRIVTMFLFIILFACLLFSCVDSAHTPDTFNFRYVLESEKAYAISFCCNEKGEYQIEEHNYFFDKFENKQMPSIYKGVFDKEQMQHLFRLIARSRLSEMKEAYGFYEKMDNYSGFIMLRVEYEYDGRSKYIYINDGKSKDLSRQFRTLQSEINEIIAEHTRKSSTQI